MTAYDKARNVDDLERENETLKKLLDLHAFLYEKRVYTCYERMVLRDVKERLPTIWTFINTIFNDDESQRLGVRECLLVMFGPEDAGVEEQSRAIVAHTTNVSPNIAFDESADGWTTLREWLRKEPHTKIPTSESSSYVLACYFLYKYTDESYSPKILGDLLDEPAVPVIAADNSSLVVDALCTRRPKDRSNCTYYQHLVVAFGCMDPDSASHVHKFSHQVVPGFITHWGLGIEEEKTAIKGELDVMHSIPDAVCTVMKRLVEHQKSHGYQCGFQVPAELFLMSVEAAVRAGKAGDEKVFFKFVPRFDWLEDQLRTQGLFPEIIRTIVDTFARSLAQTRLMKSPRPIFSFKNPDVHVTGKGSFDRLGLESPVTLAVFFAALIHVIKEAIEHTERFLENCCNEDGRRVKIHVHISENEHETIIIVENPLIEQISTGSTSSSSENVLKILGDYLKKQCEWEIREPQKTDNRWVRKFVRPNLIAP